MDLGLMQWLISCIGQIRMNATRIHMLLIFKKLNQTMREAYPHVMMIAEDSTEWPQVTGAVEEGGLVFIINGIWDG